MSERSDRATAQESVTATLNVLARLALPFLLLALLAGILWLARDALAPYLMGLLIIYILLPVVHWFERRIPDRDRPAAFRRPIAVFATVILAVVVVVGLFAILLEPLIAQTAILIQELEDFWGSIQTEHRGFQSFYEEIVPGDLRAWIDANIEQVGQSIVFGSLGVANWFVSATGSLVSSVLALVIVPLFIIFYLMDERTTAQVLRTQWPQHWAEDVVALFRIADRILGTYTRAVVTQAAIIGVVTGAGYWLVGIELALPLGLIAGAGAIVPIVGLWIALLLSVPVVLVTQPNLIIPAIVIYFAVQFVSGWILMPKMQGGSVEFTTTGTLLIIAIAGAVAGGIGLIFALPAAAIIRAVAVYTYHRLQGVAPEEAIRELRLFQRDSDHAAASILRGEDDQPAAEPSQAGATG